MVSAAEAWSRLAALRAYSSHQWEVDFRSAGPERERHPSASHTRDQVRSEAAFPSRSTFLVPIGCHRESGAKDSRCLKGGQMASAFEPETLVCEMGTANGAKQETFT